ncbi:murein biosynthesis integral membrane protein MurJ [Vibrio cholerae]|uniref:murein biosynthesis integral membrane protein MurJ n=2 Tax=Vibrio cholerae TaxID=666 RepID=UPI000E0B010B|nr:lipid II flippase MurJ [Vibrio cholerae]
MNIKKITFSALIVSFGLLIGRLSGFLRDIVIANNFGANEKSDFIVILLTTPDFIVNLLMGGALSMALIPEFKRINKEQADLLYKQVSSLLFLFGFTLAIISYFYKGELVKFLALGMDETFINNNENYFFYSLLALPFSFATGASLAYLNAKESFTVTSLGTLIVNLTIIIFISISAYLEGDFFYISIGLVLAAILRWLPQIVSINIFPFLFFIKSNLLISTELVKRYCYALFSGTIIFFLPVVVRTIASIENEGVLSLVNYSTKLVDLPLIILSSTFSLILLPYLSGKHASGDEQGFAMVAKVVATIVIVISLLALMPLVIHAHLVVQAVYGWGALNSVQTDTIVSYLSVYSFSLPFQSLNIIILAIFSARRDTKSPFYVTTILGFLLFCFLLLIKPNVEKILWSLVTFYLFMSVSFIIVMKSKYDLLLLGGRRWFIFRCVVLLIVTFLCMMLTKDFIMTMSPFLAFILVAFLIASSFLLVLWNFRREIIIGMIK